jgi:hypothetical protein
MLLKWPPLILSLGAAGFLAALRRRLPASRQLLLIAVFPFFYLLFALTAHINIGVRHVLPLYPFLLLFAGAAIEWARQAGLERQQRSGGQTFLAWNNLRWAFVLLLALQAADIARYAPGYLSYFTPFIRPTQTWRYLSDSNTDWGQGLVALRGFQRQHPNQPLSLAYVGEVDPAFYGIRYTKMTEDARPTGLVVVSATHLSGNLLHDHEAYHWLLQYPLRQMLNHSLFVFEVPPSAAPSAAPLAASSPGQTIPGKTLRIASKESLEESPLCTAQEPLCHTQDHQGDHGDGWQVIYRWP